MSTFGPNTRKLVVIQKQNKRLTRQVDINRRKTLNSQNEVFFSNQENFKKKKIKINETINNDSKIDSTNNYSSNGFDYREALSDISYIEEQNNLNDPDFSNNKNCENLVKLNETSEYIETEKISFENRESDLKPIADAVPSYKQKEINITSSSSQVLGIGHLSILHAYVRDDLFQNIKILSNHHLETKGEIMVHCLKKLNFSETRDGNLTRFVNACRAEIRKTICSRRGYVKQQIGILMTGELNYFTE
jgi:hypothetical protein